MTSETSRVDAAVPAYNPLLRAFHRAFARELFKAIEALPLPEGARVLDVPCGDGFYSRCFARRLREGGELVSCDLLMNYLKMARAGVRRIRRRPTLKFVAGDVYNLPFDAGSFDLVWCAQSFISLDEPVRALREMRRVLKPGGAIAVLESDEFHHLLLPWPVELDLTMQQAIRDASRARYGTGSKLAPARKLPRMFAQAGLALSGKTTYPADRCAPFGANVRTFLHLHFERLREFVWDRLDRPTRAAFERFVDPDAEQSIFRQVDADVTCLNTVYLGTPVGRSGTP